MQNYKAKMEQEKYYHVYNRANGNELLFRNDENYNFFLKQYQAYISPIADTLAYCLLPNHYHFLIKIKPINNINYKTSDVFKTSDVLSESFRRFLISYSKAYNKMYARKGSLFIPKFNRIEITSTQYLINAITYIHLNPVSHNLVKNC